MYTHVIPNIFIGKTSAVSTAPELGSTLVDVSVRELTGL